MKRNLLMFIFLLVGCNNTNISTSPIINSNSSIIIENNSSSIIIDETNSDSSSNSEFKDENSSTFEEEPKDEEVSKKQYIFEKNFKIYINPSVQYHNIYANNISNEGIEMSRIANEMVKLFEDRTNLDIKCNCSIKGLSLSSSIKESNNYKADYHFAIHSNAGGGKGSEIFVSDSSYDFGKTILDSLNQILPYKTRGVKDGNKASLYEIKNSKAQAVLIEILFHDDIEQAMFIIDNYQIIAETMFEGMVSYLLNQQ